MAALYFGLGLSGEQLGGLLVAVVFTYFADQVANVLAESRAACLLSRSCCPNCRPPANLIGLLD